MTAVKDRRVVVTGRIANESRETAEQKLREAGAIVQKAINKDTDVLVTGDAVGQRKINDAAKFNVAVIPWHEAFRNSGAKLGDVPVEDVDAALAWRATGVAAGPRAPMPAVRQWAPMLCKKGDLPSGGGWQYEIKWDGIRGIVTVKDGQVSIQSRSGLSDLTNRYPDVTEELAELPDCVLDGELVQMGDELGLLPDGCDPNPVARFIAWDILEDEGNDVTGLPLVQRRGLLELMVPGGCYVAPSPVFTDGQQLLDFVTEHGLEGLVAKRGSSRYVEGGRGGDWLKVKVRTEQEFIVVGYTIGEGRRSSTFGALILGYFDDDGTIVYAGKVGTGWNDDDLEMLYQRMHPYLMGDPDESYAGFPREILREGVFLRPGLVVQVAFQKWTDDHVLWHPSYQHVREDKAAADVVLET
jgi:bifunctional non-homologous end joining protein LigD